MRIVRTLAELTRDPESVVTVGTFDGVTLAHQEIIREVVRRAKIRESRSVVVTFDPHPKEVVGKHDQLVRLLSTLEERIELLRAWDIDILFIIEFTFGFSRLSSQEFYERYIVKGIGVGEVIVGYDHMFGRDREASTENLVRLGRELNFSVFAVHPYMVAGETVSSTEIRRSLAAGDIERAHKFLGRPYSLGATVIPGDGRGKKIGYPTANLRPESEKKIIPSSGVYLVAVQFEGEQYFGMMNIGVRPTVTEGVKHTVEVHIFEFDRDIYGERLTVTFIKRLREEQKFPSVQALVDQLGADKAASLRYLAEHVKR